MKIKKMGKGGTFSQKYMMNKTKKDGTLKHKEISKNKFNRLSKRYDKQDGSESLGTNTSIHQQNISGRNPNKSVSREDSNRANDWSYKFKNGGSTKWTRRNLNNSYKKFN
tara:strand:- start:54 stop:383 length:330 start_codon:yes stop_codon:yes gene_type:complete